MNVAYQHVHSRVPAPSSRVKGIPNEIDELVIAATDSDPDGRPVDAGAFLAEIADIRADLALPVVAVPPRVRPRGRTTRADARDQRHHTPDSETTDQIRGAGVHDTTAIPRRGDNGRYPAVVPPSQRRDDNGPPPPIVIPPPKQRRHVSAKTRKRRKALIVLIVFLLLGAGAGYAGWYFASGRYSRVPELVGHTRSQAVTQLKDAGYRVQVQPGPQFSDTVQKDRVLRTDPDADTRAVRGTTVIVIISAGPKLYLVPPVARKSPSDAESALRAVGIQSIDDQLKPEYSDTIPENQVTRTDPPAGTKVTGQDPITIYVSKGPAIKDVPSIAQGTPLDEAKRTLTHSAGKFKVSTTEQYSDSVAKGGVISVDPSDQAPKFSTITVTVSKGPEFVKVPDIGQGEKSEDAIAALKAVGLVPSIDDSIDGGVLDRVLSVDPAPGKLVHVGSTVTLKIV
jgi:eukaryotic-like serine/threonine-protein kinase